MQVLHLEPGHALVSGRGETRKVNTALVSPVGLGQWLLVFLQDAREVISAERAAEVNATLDLLQEAMSGLAGLESHASPSSDNPGFALPSAMDIASLRQLTQAP